MKGTFEVIAYKNNKRTVRYYTLELWNGVANYLHDHMKFMGYENIDVRLM